MRSSPARLVLLAALAPAMIAAPAASRSFQSSYVEFELPDEWACALEGTEWVCTDEREGRRSTAIVILTAKVPGVEDRLDRYQDHLATARPVRDAEGNHLGRSSRVEFVRRETMGERTWIYARHFESEVPNFFTDYLASADDDFAVLVTFSAHRDHFDRAYGRFYPSIASIRPRKP